MKNLFQMSYLSILFLLCACHSKKETEVKPVYKATSPLVENITLPRSYVANIASQRNIEIHSQQTGILQDIYVSEGQFVRAGQPLFRITIFGANEEINKTKASIGNIT